jgi:hypothetical protein
LIIAGCRSSVGFPPQPCEILDLFALRLDLLLNPLERATLVLEVRAPAVVIVDARIVSIDFVSDLRVYERRDGIYADVLGRTIADLICVED